MPATDHPTLLRMVDFPGGVDSRRVRPLIGPDSAPHYDGLAEGRLLLPRCTGCGKARFPVAPACPWCGCEERKWIEASGAGRVHSWTRYHRAFLPEFAPLIPYCVLAVRLEEGPVMIGRCVSSDPLPHIDQPAQAVIERWADKFCGLAFELSTVAR